MTSQEVQQNIDMGNRLLAAGQLADALTHYHNAIGRSYSQDNWLKTVSSWGLIDLTFYLMMMTLDGDPKNYMSFFKRGTVFLAMGKFKSALQDLDRVIELKPDFVSVSQNSKIHTYLDVS